MKYEIFRVDSWKWQIFENGVSWGVEYDTAEEAYSELFKIIRLLEP